MTMMFSKSVLLVMFLTKWSKTSGGTRVSLQKPFGGEIEGSALPSWPGVAIGVLCLSVL